MLPLKHTLFHSGNITAVKTLVFGWELESRGKKGGFLRRRGISIVSKKLLKYVYVCVFFSEHFSHVFKTLIPTSDFFSPFSA